ncbi:hypothetical protein Slin15195_G002460 [Septoria linicola]|uniref:Uncharacterized protein n=1 Tax=Septoria linicola TaxID=215465 RepID=A0A9Q9ADI6_9PEZI|nr:hypothetical protein Slin14017_G002480 [Septoria linicola]USW46927.1 hypothetical protein Slin15195_G002460 [Septoria linicola]
MPGYPDEPVSRSRDPRRERRPPPSRGYDDYDDDLYRRPSAKSRDVSYEPRPSRGNRRRETYDASDEDEYVPRRRHREERSSPKEKAQAEPEIPPPPIGDERKEYTLSSRKHRGEDRPPPGAIPVPGTEADPYHDHSSDRRRQRRSARDTHDETEEPPADRSSDRKHRKKPSRSPPAEEVDDSRAPVPDKKHAKSTRDPYGDVAAHDEEPPIANERRQRKSGRSPYDAEPEPVPVARKPSRRHRDEYDDIEPPRRSKPRDAYDEDPPRRRDPYAEPSRRRHRRAAPPPPEDSDDYDQPPRRRDDRDRRRYDDGYGTDRPRRAARDDPYERGYRTDGRDARRERDRYADRRDPRRDDRRRDDRYDDYEDTRRGSRPKSGRHGGGFDVDNIMQNGKKNWEKVAPVAKPLLAQLANTYLNNGGKGGGVPH